MLLATLVVATTYWQTWAVAGLADRQDNAIQRVAAVQGPARADLLRADGKLLAARRAQKGDGQTFYFRRYPSRRRSPRRSSATRRSRARAPGLERSLNDYLTASNSHLHDGAPADARHAEGRDGHRQQPRADDRLEGTARGASTRSATTAARPSRSSRRPGRVLVMASSPSYDPNLVERHFGAIARRATGVNCSPAAPLVNRATDGLYTPGSTFKVITAAAAARHGHVHARLDVRRPGLLHRVRQEGLELRRPERPGGLRPRELHRPRSSTRSTRSSARSARSSAR